MYTYCQSGPSLGGIALSSSLWDLEAPPAWLSGLGWL